MSIELRPCRQGWVFCDGNCEKCITITTSTTTTNPEEQFRDFANRYGTAERKMADKITLYNTEDFNPQEYVKVKHGWWVASKDGHGCECSECGTAYRWNEIDTMRYCKMCGARMDGEENE